MIMAKLLARETMVNYLATIILPKNLKSVGSFLSVGYKSWKLVIVVSYFCCKGTRASTTQSESLVALRTTVAPGTLACSEPNFVA